MIFHRFLSGKKNIVILNMVHFGALLHFQNLRKKFFTEKLVIFKNVNLVLNVFLYIKYTKVKISFLSLNFKMTKN